MALLMTAGTSRVDGLGTQTHGPGECQGCRGWGRAGKGRAVHIEPRSWSLGDRSWSFCSREDGLILLPLPTKAAMYLQEQPELHQLPGRMESGMSGIPGARVGKISTLRTLFRLCGLHGRLTLVCGPVGLSTCKHIFTSRQLALDHQIEGHV